jgi:hypothetical protein
MTKRPRPSTPEEAAPDRGADVPEPTRRTSDIMLVEIAKIQSGVDHTNKLLGEVRADVKELRDRMAKLEVRVDHLPSKGFIVSALVIVLTILGTLITLAPKLQGLLTTPTASVSSPAH